MKYLTVSHLNKFFGDTQVLKDINFSVNPGEFICFLGPSGCGKTTLLRTIAGLEQQSSGEIIQAGDNIEMKSAKDRDFGIVFQSYALFPNMTVRQNIGFGLKKLSKSSRLERVNELLHTIDLDQHGDKYPSQLSGGQQQRVALARAIALNPGLLLLDEPLSALDAKVRVHLRREIKALQKKLGVTTIMVTHDQEEALTMADRIVVMNNGCIEQIATPETLYQSPNNQFVAEFVGTSNFVASKTLNQLGYQLDTRESHVSIRPERIAVTDQFNAGDEILAHESRIEHIEFLGNVIRINVYVDALQQSLIVDVSPQKANSLHLAMHQDLWLSLPLAHLNAFDEAC